MPAERTQHHYPSTLRILQKAGRKLAIRLEDLFWSQLREFAAEDGKRLSALVFDILKAMPEGANRTALLRCYCLDRSRKRASEVRLGQLNFDMLAIIAACPAPVIVLTPTRRIAAFNPAFSASVLGPADGRKRDERRPINLTFSEPLPRIYRDLLDDPRHISAYQLGVSDGLRTTQHRARFALLDRRMGEQSHLIVYLES